MKMLKGALPLAALPLLAVSGLSVAADIELAGDDATGYLSLANVKATNDQATAESWDFPYYLDENGIFQSIAAVPLSVDSVYSEEALYTVLGKDITSGNFSTLSAGTISFDDEMLSGVGVETVGVDALTLAINGQGFSPFFSEHNSGAGFGDFAFNYTITASNATGAGLTFVDGALTSVDLDADISVAVEFGAGLGAFFGDTYDGSLSITGATYAFDVDVTQDTTSLLGDLNNTHLVFNRTGTIAAVSPIPEPSVYAMFAGGLIVLSAFARKHRRA